MKKIMKSKKGITLISLVVTIIILLILAGISIGMLSGDNSIIGQAGNAKTQTDIAEEKEILQTATLAAMGKSKYGDITKEKLDNELNKYSEIESTEQTDKGIVVTFKSNRAYLVNSDGDVSSYSDITIGNLVVKDGNTVLTENCKSVQLGKSLTINFEANIPGGSITSITPNIEFTTSGERRKTFTIFGKTSEGKGITKEYTVNLNGYYNIPKIQVGDFVKYDVEYQDMSDPNIYYNMTNGWRLLNYKENSDGTYSDIELISTGIPVNLYYADSTSAVRKNNSWWVNNDNELANFKKLLTDNHVNDYNFYSGTNNSYYGLQFSAGMYYNFEDIIFRYGTNCEKNYNQGYYKNIKNEEKIYSDLQNKMSENGEELTWTAKNLFTIGNVRVRTLTLAEINKVLERKEKDNSEKYDIDSMEKITDEEDPKGIFKLVNTGLGHHANNSWWVASPYSNNRHVFTINESGSISVDATNPRGVRPVITFKNESIKFDISDDGKYFIIE